MKLSTLVLLFLLAFFQVSAKPSAEFADEESESEEYANEMDTVQEEWNFEDLEGLEDFEDLQFEEGELEDFLADEAEAKNPQKVLKQRTSIIKKILQLQQKLQSLVITPGNPFGSFSFGSSGGLNYNQLLQLLQGSGGLGGFGGFGGGSSKGLSQSQLYQLLYGTKNPFGSSSSFGGFGGNSKQLTKLLKKLGGGNSQLYSLFQNPAILQNPQLLYYLLLLQGGKGFKLPSFKAPSFKIPKAPKVKTSQGPQMCWCPCQQVNAPTQKFTGNWGGLSNWGTVGLGSGFNSWPNTGSNFFFEELSNEQNAEEESEEIVVPYSE
jgi:hypothetical protein